jgi:Ca2+-binding RTX toxin-like protein
VAAADGDDDQYDGGDGTDTLDYSAVLDDFIADLGAGTVEGAEAGNDTNTGFEALIAGSGDDTVIDGGDYSSIETGAGNDTVVAAADGGDDQYDGGDGDDTLDYSASQSAVLIDLQQNTATGIEIGTDAIASFEAIVGGTGDDHFVVTDQPVSLEGGAGSDVFQFEALTGQTTGTQVVHDILDFMVGDRIKISKYEIFKEVMNSLEDRFEDIYGDAVNEDELPIRIRHEQTDQVRQTLIDVDFDRDDTYEMTINIIGDHVLMVVDHT